MFPWPIRSRHDTLKRWVHSSSEFSQRVNRRHLCSMLSEGDHTKIHGEYTIMLHSTLSQADPAHHRRSSTHSTSCASAMAWRAVIQLHKIRERGVTQHSILSPWLRAVCTASVAGRGRRRDAATLSWLLLWRPPCNAEARDSTCCSMPRCTTNAKAVEWR